MQVVSSDVNPDTTAQRVPGAKVRILETADRLFYTDGIRTVGIDRLISESKVTKATFYKHYGSKDRLILEYIEGRHRHERARLEELAASAAAPDKILHSVIAGVTADLARSDFRGDAFLNAAIEFPDPQHPVREVVSRHRDWYSGFIADLLQAAGHHMAGDAADELILALDGAMTGGYAGDEIAASAALGRVAERIIGEAKK